MATWNYVTSESDDRNSTSSPYGDVIDDDQRESLHECAHNIPTTQELFAHMPTAGLVLVAILILTVMFVVAVYIEELVFIFRNFKPGSRRKRTVWILAFFPVFALCGLLGVIVPRSGTLVDMISNVFFSTCLYNFGYLMMNYIGGADNMWRIIGDNRDIRLNTPPCCCCCVCLPVVRFHRSVYLKIALCVLQVAVVRPVIMFLAAVLWTNGSYLPGNMSADSAYLYISVINLVSTLAAYYGLTLTRIALLPELEKKFSVTGKILSLQLTLLSSSIPNLIIGILVTHDVIQCGELFPSKARGEAIYHGLLATIMLPCCLIGRKFYRRKSDGVECVAGNEVINS